MTSSNPESAPAKKSSAAAITMLMALIAIMAAALALGWLWRIENRSGELEQEGSEVTAQVHLLEERLQRTENDLRAIQSRQQDAATVNRNLRGEMLAIAERAELLETALKRVSDRGIDNVAELRLNNAELLMTAGMARLRLFRDTTGTLLALQWADAELATLRDPVVAGIRQSLARELEALSAVPADHRTLALASLRRMNETVDALPSRDTNKPFAEANVEANSKSRIRQLLSNFIQVRQLDANTPSFSRPLRIELARDQLHVHLLHLESALLEADDTRLQQLLTDFESTAKTNFELKSESGKSLLSDLQLLRTLPTLSTLDVIGSALSQLRNLQDTRRLAYPSGVTE